MVTSKSSSPNKNLAGSASVPTFGGRLVIAALLAAAAGLPATVLPDYPATWLEKALKMEEQKPVDMTAWQAGKTEEIEITLVTADFDKLACALDREISGSHCAFKTEKDPWPTPEGAPLDDNKRNTIQPYSAVPDNALVMIAGLWAQPAVAFRLHQEPPQGVAVKKLARFIARCKVRPVERVANISLRWEASASWQKGVLRSADGRDLGRPWVAVAEECSVRDE